MDIIVVTKLEKSDPLVGKMLILCIIGEIGSIIKHKDTKLYVLDMELYRSEQFLIGALNLEKVDIKGPNEIQQSEQVVVLIKETHFSQVEEYFKNHKNNLYTFCY